MRKTQIVMNKQVYLGLSILTLSKTVMYEFWYDYVKPKYGEKAKLFYMDKDSFIFHVKTDDIYKDIADDVETKFDTSNFEIDTPLPKEKNKKVIRLMKDDLGGNIMNEFVGLRVKSYLKENNGKCKKEKGTKKRVIKRKLKFQDYRNCLRAAKIENKINYSEKEKFDLDNHKEGQREFVKNKLRLKTQQGFKSERHNVFTEEINKISLSSNDDKRMSSIGLTEKYAYGTSKDIIYVKEKIKHYNVIHIFLTSIIF